LSEFTLHYGQSRLLNDRTKDEHAIIAGYGYGKTSFMPRWHTKRCVDNPKSAESIVVAPNYRLLKNRCLVEFRRFLISIGMTEGRNADFFITESASDMKLVFWWGHTVHFISGQTPDNLVSYNASHISIDEPALMDEEVISRVVARLRCPDASYRQILFTGTPEGLNWFFERFHPNEVIRQPGTPFSESSTRLVLHGSSHDNPYLDEKYLRILEEEYGWDPDLYANYVLGEWVSLSRNRFYHAFNASRIGEYPPDPETRTLYLTFDNNVGCMTWAVIQPWTDKYLVVSDNGGNARNIDEACEQFIEHYSVKVWGRHHVVVLGDAALWARSTHSNQTGYEIIRDNLTKHYPRLTIAAPRANPFVEERSRNTNKLFAKGRLLVDAGAKRVIQSAQSAETDPVRGIKKPNKDQVTHAMEAVDMAMLVLEPLKVKREHVGIK
jgi:hypothetical protein